MALTSSNNDQQTSSVVSDTLENSPNEFNKIYEVSANGLTLVTENCSQHQHDDYFSEELNANIIFPTMTIQDQFLGTSSASNKENNQTISEDRNTVLMEPYFIEDEKDDPDYILEQNPDSPEETTNDKDDTQNTTNSKEDRGEDKSIKVRNRKRKPD